MIDCFHRNDTAHEHSIPVDHPRTGGSATLMLTAACLLGAVGNPLGADVSPTRIDALTPVLAARPPRGFGPTRVDRAAWKALAAHPAFSGVIARAERIAVDPVPEQPDELYLDFSRTGNRRRWESVAFRRRGHITTLVLAECCEAKGRFIAKIEEYIRAVCAEKTWVMPAHDRALTNFKQTSTSIDLASSALAWELAMARYMLGDALSAAARTLIADNVTARVLAPYRDMLLGKRDFSGNWWMHGTNNWNAVCLAGVTGCALIVLDDPRERALYAAAAEHYIRYFLRGFTADGYCSEGLGYWNYGFGHFILLTEALRQATGGKLDLFADPVVREPALFPVHIEIVKGVYPAFADCSVNARPGAAYSAYINARLATAAAAAPATDTTTAHGYLFDAMLFNAPEAWRNARVTPQDADATGTHNAAELRFWFDKAGILVCRPREGRHGNFGAAMKGGNNAEHHNHNDVGSYVVVVGNTPILVDPGSEVYTARTFSSKRYESNVLNSFGHPVPVIDARLQHTGRDAAGRVIAADFSESADTLSLDIASAYKSPTLAALRRTFTFDRHDRGALIVRDDVEFKSPAAFETALITLGDWHRESPETLIVYDGDAAVRVRVNTGGLAFTVKCVTLEEDTHTRTKPKRLGLALAAPVTHATVTLTIDPISLAPPDSAHGLLRNGGFELGTVGWTIAHTGISSISTEKAAGGVCSLHIEDESRTTGSGITSAAIGVDEAHTYTLTGNVFHVTGEGLGIYANFYDANGKNLNDVSSNGITAPLGTAPAEAQRWANFAFEFTPPPGTRTMRVWLHSYNGSVVNAYVDDLCIRQQ